MASAAPLQFTYDIDAVMRRFGQTQRTPRWQVAYVARLIERLSFPAPLPLMRGGDLIEDVTPRSRWSCGPVDQWFDDRTPTGAAAIDPARRRQADRDMDDRADRIALRIVNGGRA